MGSGRPASAPPPSLRKLSKEEAKQAVMGMCLVSMRPLLVGVVAVRLGSLWSLEETEELFQALMDEGKIRPINELEKRRFDLREGYVPVGVKPSGEP